MATHNDLGKTGEDLACEFLFQNGYEIVERNWRWRKAEVDLIARKQNMLVAVEVKTRSETAFGLPQDFVKPAQIKMLVGAMDHYVNQFKNDHEVRFDIIAVCVSGNNISLEHLADAFYHF